MQRWTLEENGLNIALEITDEREVKLLHFSALPFDEATLTARTGVKAYRMVEIMATGNDRPGERFGNKYTLTSPGNRLLYEGHADTRNRLGRRLALTQYDAPTGLAVTTIWQFYDGIPVVRAWTEVENRGSAPQGLEYVSSFALTGVEKEGLRSQDDKMRLWIPHHSWVRELQWQSYTLEQLGMAQARPLDDQRSSKAISVSNTGNWSAKQYLPMGYLENLETGSNLFWQIEHNGSWHWELDDEDGNLSLKLSGPTEIESHWWKELAPGETFTTVPVSVGATLGGFDEAMGALTRYRRAIRRPNADNERLGIIFNDYMNCLWGDPTTEKELPLIDAASAAGCEYYCIDCGWYSPGFWWDGVGEWLPSQERFPGGLREVMDYIRKKGMIPGVWLELEVMGVKCPKAARVPQDWFFQRHGRVVYDRSRTQLDFRNPEVLAHADEVIDRLVQEYGVGYIKMDYNIEPGIGTDRLADSPGDGLLGHNRAYLAWLDRVFQRYPDLIIENCSSGGLRMDYAMLSRYSIQSTSDQEDYRRYATIAANAPSGLTPEQSAIWSYPLTDGDREEVVFNMVNAMLMRIHQSGHLVNLSPERKALVKEALDAYKDIRGDIRQALPFWPLGLSCFSDGWVALGLKTADKAYLAVWRRDSQGDTLELPLNFLRGEQVAVRCLYPSYGDCQAQWHPASASLTVRLPHPVSARLFELSFSI